MEPEIIPLVIKYNDITTNKIINSNCKSTINAICYEIFCDLVPSAGELSDLSPLVFYVLNGRLVSPNMILADIANPNCINILECHVRVRGGFELEDIPPQTSPTAKVYLDIFQSILW